MRREVWIRNLRNLSLRVSTLKPSKQWGSPSLAFTSVSASLWLTFLKTSVFLHISSGWWKPSVGVECNRSFFKTWPEKNYLRRWSERGFFFLMQQKIILNLRWQKKNWKGKNIKTWVPKLNGDSLPHGQFCHWLTHLEPMRTLSRALDFKRCLFWYYSNSHFKVQAAESNPVTSHHWPCLSVTDQHVYFGFITFPSGCRHGRSEIHLRWIVRSVTL